MKIKHLVIASALCIATLAPQCCWAGHKNTPAQSVPIIMMRSKRYVTNCSWSSEQVRMGGSEVSTYITGHGGEHDATARYTLDGDNANKFEMFEATVGYKDNTVEGRSAVFEVWVNGQKAASKGPLVSGDPPERMRVNIKGAKEVLLRIVPQRYNDTMNAMWGDPMLCTKYVEEEDNPSIDVKGEKHAFRANPNSFNGDEEINLPIPVYTGTHEFLLHYEYDKQKQRMTYTLTHTNAHPQVGATFTNAAPQNKAE